MTFDLNTALAADEFVAAHFDGDYERAALFFAELAEIEGN